MTTGMLEVKDLAGGYEGRLIFADISFDLGAGAAMSVIAGHGQGKTTLLKSIVGIISPICGQIMFRGREIRGLSPSELVRRGLVLVPEGRPVFRSLTVRDNLLLGGYLNPKRRSQYDSMMTTFSFLHLRAGQLASSLSGGEQQILMIARGLMSMPSLLLVDEPFVGLSPKNIDLVVSALIEIQRLGTALIITAEKGERLATLSNLMLKHMSNASCWELTKNERSL